MKKFAFTLQVLLNVKEMLEKQQRAALINAEKKLQRLKDELSAMRFEYETNNEEYLGGMAKGMDAYRAQFYSNYFAHLQELIAQQIQRIAVAEVERTQCQVVLVQTMTEIKVLEKLREKQYQEYLVELAKEQDKEMGDFVSYQVISKAEGEN